MTKLVAKGMHFGRKTKQLMIVSSSKANPPPVPNRKSPIALAHAYALMIACVLICCAVVFTDSWCVATSRGCGQAFVSGLLPHMLISYHSRLEKGVCVCLCCRWRRENSRYPPLRKGLTSQPDDVDCIVASSVASNDAFLICFDVMNE